MKKKTMLVGIVALLMLVGYQSTQAQRKAKDAPIEMEIAGDVSKVRRALIKVELESGWDKGDEPESANQITFHEHLTGYRRVLGDSFFRHKFVIAGSEGTTTIYGRVEQCYDKEEKDCRVINSKAALANLEYLMKWARSTVLMYQ
jgi:hypothetical protein